jgi:hypothetical protein
MPLYNGNEFDSQKGSHWSVVKLVWSKIYDKFLDYQATITTALQGYYTKIQVDGFIQTLTTNLSNEVTVRADSFNDLQAQILGLKTITPWDVANAFPTQRVGAKPFKQGNYVQVTTSGISGGVNYKAGDILICFVDNATTVAGFADIDSNVEIATSTIFGTVKLLADLASYQGAGLDSSVITKSVLSAILSNLSNTITNAFTTADDNIRIQITNAYDQAITTALNGYYTKLEIDSFIADRTSKAKTVELAGIVQNEVMQALRRVSNRIETTVAKNIVEVISDTFAGGVATLKIEDKLIVIFSYLGVRLKGKNIAGAFPLGWAVITDADKGDYDYLKYTFGGIDKLYFNPDALTNAEASNCTVLVLNSVTFTDAQMATFLKPVSQGGVGNDNDTTVMIIPDYILTLQTPN